MKQLTRRRLYRSLQVLGVLAVAIALAAAVIYGIYRHRHAHDRYLYGVSFSVKYARELNVDWRQTYDALIDDLGVRHLRLMSYWDDGEPSPGQYDFTALDYQMRRAEQAGVSVSLAVGLRQPRYPECHQPPWADGLPIEQRDAALDGYITQVVKRYAHSPALISYQLENEALNTNFGRCHDFRRSRLVSEYQLVKALDQTHPIIVSVSNEFGLPLGQPHGDVAAFSIYRRVYEGRFLKTYFNYPLPSWWHGVRAAIIEVILNRPVIIHELQTEPWGPQATGALSVEEQNKSMDSVRVLEQVRYAKDTGIHEMYLWGGEWWYWRLVHYHDPSLWQAAKSVFSGQF